LKSIRVPPALWAEVERRIPARERSAFIRRAIERELQVLEKAEPSMDAGRSILEMVDEVWSGLPAEEAARLPVDLSENLDHYLYGAPRRP